MDEGIQICIALPEFGSSEFNNIIKEIIKKSLFTEKQIQIILNHRKLVQTKFDISKGAYYRQVSQSRDKLVRLFYSIIMLKGLGLLSTQDDDVISKLSQQISVIQRSDVFPEKEEEISGVIDRLVRQSTRM